jgi:DNA-directed RNA polymerase specialized sigma24 family protein
MKAGLAMDYGKQSLAQGSVFRRLEWDHRRSHSVSNDNSVTCWLDGIRLGDGAQIQRLWDRYFERLVRLAGSRLPGHSRRAYDEEDVALSAFKSFCDGIMRGQFPHLADRDDLWRLLATITTRKVIGTLRYEGRRKRGGGMVVGESAVNDANDRRAEGMGGFLSREPTVEAATEFAEAYDRLFERLADPMLKFIALRKLEGRTTDEVATELGTTRRTIDRKLRLIRALWQEEAVG